MPQSLAKVLVHLVFSTKDRRPLITPAVEPALQAYIHGILVQLDSPSLLAGGTNDHIHVLFALSKNRPLVEVVQEVKRGSSKWMKTQGVEFRAFYWQNGYGAFSIGESGVANLKAYIRNQRLHHSRRSFQDELRLLFQKYGVVYDERYVWD